MNKKQKKKKKKQTIKEQKKQKQKEQSKENKVGQLSDWLNANANNLKSIKQVVTLDDYHGVLIELIDSGKCMFVPYVDEERANTAYNIIVKYTLEGQEEVEEVEPEVKDIKDITSEFICSE